METLTEQDLDWLTSTGNRLIRIRKRESINTNSRYLIDQLTEAIEKVHHIRQTLQMRFGHDVNEDIRRDAYSFEDMIRSFVRR